MNPRKNADIRSSKRTSSLFFPRNVTQLLILLNRLFPYFLVVTVLPIVFTPYGGDDIINHNTWPNLKDPFNFAFELSNAWLNQQGRFFPTAFTLMAAIFSYFKSRLAYKILLAIFAFLSALILRSFLRRVFSTEIASTLGSYYFISTISIRLANDPWSQFHGLIPIALIMTISAPMLAIKAVKNLQMVWLVFSIIAIWIGGTSYELAYLALFPSIYIVLTSRFHTKAKFAYALLALLPIFIAGFSAINRRLSSEPVAGKYSYSLTNWDINVYLAQLSDVFPGPLRFLAFEQNKSAVALSIFVIVMVLAAAVIFEVHSNKTAKSWSPASDSLIMNHSQALLLFSATLIFLPPAILALSAEWTNTAIGKTPYLFGPFMCAGVTLLISMFTESLSSSSRSPSIRRMGLLSSALVLAGLVFLNTFSNFALVEQLIPGERLPASIETCTNLPWSC